MSDTDELAAFARSVFRHPEPDVEPIETPYTRGNYAPKEGQTVGMDHRNQDARAFIRQLFGRPE